MTADYKAKPSDILRRARAKLAKDGGWTQREFARNEYSSPVSPESHYAVSFCSLGAVNSACFDLGLNVGMTVSDMELEAIDYLKKYIDGGYVTVWNDYKYRTKDDVLGTFDAAILQAQRDRK